MTETPSAHRLRLLCSALAAATILTCLAALLRVAPDAVLGSEGRDAATGDGKTSQSVSDDPDPGISRPGGGRAGDAMSPLEATRALLPSRFVAIETPRYVVLSDVDASIARQHASYLERARHQFERFAARLGMNLNEPGDRFVCVLFERREEFRRFAREHDGVDNPSVAGYYAPSSRRVVFYHPRSNPSVDEAERVLAEMTSEIHLLDDTAVRARRSGRGEQARTIRDATAHYRAHVDREREKVERFIDRVAIATTLHEAVHQLAFEMGLQSARVRYPLWISEGLAAAFETDRPGQSFGPDYEHDSRREAFEDALRRGAVVPLRTLATMTALPDSDAGAVADLYHQSYALVTWMMRFERDGLRAYLETMRNLAPGGSTPQGLLEVFESAFGDVDRLEHRWRRYEHDRLDAPSALTR